ncbi:MAG: DUF4396 domain-containing protein [Burkholderiales bacterium]|nr:DUF4396 domain-containing protein [Burkholderiales bacterium]
MLDGVMLLWFALAGLSVLFVAVDVRHVPAAPVMKWAFVLVTAYTGPIGAFLYVLGCREPLRRTHERYTAFRWKQTLGSTMHCVAGDGAGILAGAVAASLLHLPAAADVALEYVLGFGFGWTIFQALFMRKMAGGSYVRALRSTFLPELLSMNLLMAGMVPLANLARAAWPAGHAPSNPEFWFVMSMALLLGSASAYPVNWWLVAKGLKHGMMTVRDEPAGEAARHAGTRARGGDAHGGWAGEATRGEVLAMTLASFAALGAGVAVAVVFGSLGGGGE